MWSLQLPPNKVVEVFGLRANHPSRQITIMEDLVAEVKTAYLLLSSET
ncbi:hypothetical protein H310_10472 [Aphanomyces invadans]|uniref:Uncharacterized protein n=1 Tax=Aphanomyces invadans TaxID=157072 RepID=A0A024TSJ1_9STRA|nr:hypothetical protein H310_10472 [Aphanomyces invadans]ETV96307.1 hypothetical protein H310_10472 [Aphanomyces invadans]|eukprot:XP_008875099.1 hypothetical protein H310_10472 [Aphanomyces invadans]